MLELIYKTIRSTKYWIHTEKLINTSHRKSQQIFKTTLKEITLKNPNLYIEKNFTGLLMEEGGLRLLLRPELPLTVLTGGSAALRRSSPTTEARRGDRPERKPWLVLLLLEDMNLDILAIELRLFRLNFNFFFWISASSPMHLSGYLKPEREREEKRGEEKRERKIKEKEERELRPLGNGGVLRGG